jgi:hypothetical protein
MNATGALEIFNLDEPPSWWAPDEALREFQPTKQNIK